MRILGGARGVTGVTSACKALSQSWRHTTLGPLVSLLCPSAWMSPVSPAPLSLVSLLTVVATLSAGPPVRILSLLLPVSPVSQPALPSSAVGMWPRVTPHPH